MSKAQKNFLSGALILTVANFIVKIIGAIYKIPLANFIEPTGMNYYNDAYQIYSMLYVLSTAGIPTAIAKIVSEANAQNRLTEPKRVLKLSTIIFAGIGIVLSALMMIFVEPISAALSNDTTNYCITMIAPAILLVSVSAVIKGYFQGYKCMTHSASFLIVEALFKLAGLGLVVFLRFGQGITDPLALACGGVLGVTFGAFAGTIFMLIRLIRERDLGKNTDGSLPAHRSGTLIKTIITLAIPISLSSSVMSVAATLDMILVKRNLLVYGLDAEAVKEVYGAYAGATGSLFNLPQALTVNIGIAVLPFLTSALASGHKEDAFKNIRSSAKLVALLAMPFSFGMCFLSEPIVKFLYNESYWEVGIPTLTVLALSEFFVSFVSLSNSYLHSVGKVKTALFSMGIGAAMKVIVNILAVQNIGIMGAPIGTFACYGSITLLNLIFIKKYIGFTFPAVETFLKPLLCSLITCGAAFGAWWLLDRFTQSTVLSLFPALVVALIMYLLCIRLFKLLNKEDLEFLPGKIGKLLLKSGWLHE
ncbi:MAG: polysaccharide biosynthesis protein [Clostridia bacterium]|nr:polysaccharide biosynthesis protein [Clostridia bacterium]